MLFVGVHAAVPLCRPSEISRLVSAIILSGNPFNWLRVFYPGQVFQNENVYVVWSDFVCRIGKHS